MNKVSFFTSCLLLIASIFIVYFFSSRSDVIVVDKGFDDLPFEITGYSGKDISMADNVIRELDTDIYIFRNYIGETGTITLYIGYYGTAKGGRTGHNPNACYPSSGFAILDESKVTVPVQFSNGESTREVVTRLLIAKNDEEKLVYHWYQSSGDQILADGIEQNIHRFKTRLLLNRNDGAFVRISSTVQKSISGTESDLSAFAKIIIPMLEQYWPVEQEKSNEP